MNTIFINFAFKNIGKRMAFFKIIQKYIYLYSDLVQIKLL